MLITRRVATGLLLVPIAGLRVAAAQAAAAARLTFVLVNDIYLMSDVMMPDGKRRGGFARLAAVVKAERARASAAGSSRDLRPWRRHVVSVIDVGHRPRRQHHDADQHDPARHLRARQPRIRFRQGCLPRAHGRGKVSALCREPARRGRGAAAGLHRPLACDGQGRAHRAHRRDLRGQPARVRSRRPQIFPIGRDHDRAGQGVAPRGRRLRRRGRARHPRAGL